MPRTDPCERCGVASLYPHHRESCDLNLAIAISSCPYCHSGPGESCVSAYGKPDQPNHIGRVHAAHELLAATGRPLAATPFIVKDDGKGQRRQHWDKRRREAGLE